MFLQGITNLHAPSDVIIDASMPVVVRDSGKMWNKDDELEDVKCVIPDRCYATMYQEVMSFVKSEGQFDVATSK
ncbi:monomeric isocitrate dehydrogenase-domain-containing protein [Ochromonadaceae sp. CCMP2298]|nr:monomeric isocitrate dehydrogenase-domain-containing protein [Ochromonadaceae sp. CCMP2298]